VKEIVGRNLQMARDLAGLSQEEFAVKLGISRATLSAIENGHVAVDSTKLLLASRILGRPVADFFREDKESLALMYRAVADTTAPYDVRLAFERYCKAYRELEEMIGVGDNLLQPPDYSYSAGSYSKPLQYADQVARSERERLGLGQLDPIQNIFRLLDEQGVRILRRVVEGNEIFGISAYSRQYGLCILINKANTIERQIFSLAHEYGHLLMHRLMYSSTAPCAGLDKESESELMANRFAATFLVPEPALWDVFRRDIGEKMVGLEDVVFLKQYFHVSGDMMLRRLHDLQLISEAEHQRLLDEVNQRRGDTKKEFIPSSDDMIDAWEKSSRFEHFVRKAALNGMLSLGKVAELTDLNVREAKARLQEWRRNTELAQA
jgi:Zn-dependent peptidase ImmA (M78 family)/transcriptional regulator with XRE-family HTH domain